MSTEAAVVPITKQHLINLFGDDSTCARPDQVDLMEVVLMACAAMQSIAGELDVLASASKDERLSREDLFRAIRGVARRLDAAANIVEGFGDVAEAQAQNGGAP